MKGRRNPFVAAEGIPFLIAAVAVTGLVWNGIGFLYAIIPAGLFVYLLLIFRDPKRAIPAVPLGIVSPVDGTIVNIDLTDKGVLNQEAHKITMRVNSLGTYTARCPVEGKIMDFRGTAAQDATPVSTSGLWVRTDEDDDVILQFHGHCLGLAPAALLRYGERIGQGQRCAYLRLTRFAEVQLPINSRVLVSAGQRVSAGEDVLAKLPHP